MPKNEEYNGYKNYQTWNVSLWLFNDECLYYAAVEFMKSYKGARPYAAFIRRMGIEQERTPDHIKWLSTRLDYKTLNNEMFDLCNEEIKDGDINDH